jgi:hypothetical protein
MDKHTEGPWFTRMAKDFEGKVWEGEGHPYTIGSEIGTVICRGAVNGSQTEANARLIAAAPDMLEALRQIVWKLERKEEKIALVGHTFEWAKIDRNDACMNIVRTAIQKAEGNYAD